MNNELEDLSLLFMFHKSFPIQELTWLNKILELQKQSFDTNDYFPKTFEKCINSITIIYFFFFFFCETPFNHDGNRVCIGISTQKWWQASSQSYWISGNIVLILDGSLFSVAHVCGMKSVN